jgi:hypothetical protein
MEEIHSSETSVLTRATPLHVPEDNILYRHHLETLKSAKINRLGSVTEK